MVSKFIITITTLTSSIFNIQQQAIIDIDNYDVVDFNNHNNINWGNSIFRTGDSLTKIENFYNYSQSYNSDFQNSYRDLVKLNKLEPNNVILETNYQNFYGSSKLTRYYTDDTIVEKFRDDILTSIPWKNNGAYSDENWYTAIRLINNTGEDLPININNIRYGFGFNLTKPLNTDIEAFTIGIAKTYKPTQIAYDPKINIDLIITDFTEKQHVFNLKLIGNLNQDYIVGHLPYAVRGIKRVEFEFENEYYDNEGYVNPNQTLIIGASISNFNLFSEYNYRPGIPILSDEDLFEYENCDWNNFGCHMRNAIKFLPNLIYTTSVKIIVQPLTNFINNIIFIFDQLFQVLDWIPSIITDVVKYGLFIIISYKIIKVVA